MTCTQRPSARGGRDPDYPICWFSAQVLALPSFCLALQWSHLLFLLCLIPEPLMEFSRDEMSRERWVWPHSFCHLLYSASYWGAACARAPREHGPPLSHYSPHLPSEESRAQGHSLGQIGSFRCWTPLPTLRFWVSLPPLLPSAHHCGRWMRSGHEKITRKHQPQTGLQTEYNLCFKDSFGGRCQSQNLPSHGPAWLSSTFSVSFNLAQLPGSQPCSPLGTANKTWLYPAAGVGMFSLGPDFHPETSSLAQWLLKSAPSPSFTREYLVAENSVSSLCCLQWACQSTLIPGHLGERCYFRSLRALDSGTNCSKNPSVSPSSTSRSFFSASGWLEDSLALLALLVHTMSRILCRLLPSAVTQSTQHSPQDTPSSSLLVHFPPRVAHLGGTEQIPLQTGGSGHCATRGTQCMNPHSEIIFTSGVNQTRPHHGYLFKYSYLTFHSHHKLPMLPHWVMRQAEWHPKDVHVPSLGTC